MVLWAIATSTIHFYFQRDAGTGTDLEKESAMPGDGEELTSVKQSSPEAPITGSGDGRPVRRFTSNELRELNQPHNVHVAVRGKVYYWCCV